jgi:hypothetical protein
MADLRFELFELDSVRSAKLVVVVRDCGLYTKDEGGRCEVDDMSTDKLGFAFASGDQNALSHQHPTQSSTSPIIDESGETALVQPSEFMKIATPDVLFGS